MNQSTINYMKEQISIYREAINEIENRRPELKSSGAVVVSGDEDARKLIVCRASLSTLEENLKTHCTP